MSEEMMQELRKDLLTAQKVDTGMVFRQMLGCDDAQAYLRAENVPETVIERVVAARNTRLDQRDAALVPSEAPQASAPSALSALSAPPEQPGSQGFAPPLPPGLHDIAYGHSGRRRNVLRAAIVQAAIAVDEQLGRERATRLLQREGVPDEIIARVLSDDARRRGRGPAM